MLNKLTIKNIALIESVTIDFSKGLNVLSGETGSGKSVIIESLNFVLGAKADRSLIRSGQNDCYVCAEFDVANNKSIQDAYTEFDFDCDDVLILSRKFDINGKNSIKINGNTVNVSMLRRFTRSLVDVHGQSEHFELLNVGNQLKLLDNFSGEENFSLKEKIKVLYDELKIINNSLDELGGDESYRLNRLDVLNFQINEIENAGITETEEDELLIIREKIKNQEKIINSLNVIKQALNGENGVSDLVLYSIKNANLISNFAPEYENLANQLSGLIDATDGVINETESMLESFDYNEYDNDYIEQRLEIIKTLKKKYGGGYNEIMAFLETAIVERDKLNNFNENAEKLLKRKQIVLQELFVLYEELSKIRKEKALILSKNVCEELLELGMPSAKFEISFSDTPDFYTCKFDSANGYDQIEFLFSANLGEPLKNLSAVISGGEMSRFMLAIKAQSAKYNDVSTYVFDEIDAGISGKVASTVAKKLVKISKNTQVIAITHLPQISVYADNNLLISKSEEDDRTVSSVKALDSEDKINEIIRLVGGSVDSVSARQHSLELISEAEEYKNSL